MNYIFLFQNTDILAKKLKNMDKGTNNRDLDYYIINEYHQNKILELKREVDK